MNNQPLFSILIANYNNAQYLLDAVESVLRQTYAHWEIVIVDDGSTDNSLEIYELLKKDERIRVFSNERNMGCAWTKHQCVLHAQGKYCGYLDPDDELLPNAIEVTVAILDKEPDVVLTMSRYYRCDIHMNILSESRLLELADGENYFEHHDYQPEVFAGFRKNAYIKSGGLNTSYQAAVDQDLYFKLDEQGKIKVINEFTYKYRKNPKALTSDPLWCEYWNIVARHDACVRRGLPVKEYAYGDFKHEIAWQADCVVTEKIRTSKQYKIGAWILHPIESLKQLVKKRKYLLS